jgi:hypothetical protein
VNPLTLYFAWKARRRAAKALQMAEHRRKVIEDQIGTRRAGHREWKPLLSDLQRATKDSLRAYVDGRA